MRSKAVCSFPVSAGERRSNAQDDRVETFFGKLSVRAHDLPGI
jgi:hypothetical protein